MTTNAQREPRARARDALIARGGEIVDLPTLVPASLVLELAGEGLRQRLFFTTAPDGSESCLRADLTIPAALRYIEEAHCANDEIAWVCQGPVFRAPRPADTRKPEFVQIGLERYGNSDLIATDVTVFLSAYDACATATQAPLHVSFYDGGLLPSILTKANIDDVWRQALLEQAGHRRSFLNVLQQASTTSLPRRMDMWDELVLDLPYGDARALVNERLNQSAVSLGLVRSIDDITNRLIARASRLNAKKLSTDITDTLQLLATYNPQSSTVESLDNVVAMASKIGVDLKPWRMEWQERLAKMSAEIPGILSQAQFAAIGEEAFDYYDGMAFDIATSNDFSRPIATGGRYDGLISEISHGRCDARAIGCVIRPDRFESVVS